MLVLEGGGQKAREGVVEGARRDGESGLRRGGQSTFAALVGWEHRVELYGLLRAKG